MVCTSAAVEISAEADTVSDVRALSRKALLRVLEKFPEEEELPGGRSTWEGPLYIALENHQR